jgi:hypothetical protein
MKDLINDYEIVEGKCKDCDLESNSCITLCEKLIPEEYIFKKKEKWVTCTPENTEVGDRVKFISDGSIHKVKYIHETEDAFLLDTNTCMDDMDRYEVKEK